MEVQEVPLHPMLRLIDVMAEYPKERAEALWNHLQSQDYAFDDLTKADPAKFAMQFFNPETLLFEIEDMQGLISVTQLVPGVNATLHLAVWGDVPAYTIYKLGHSVIRWVFQRYNLHRLTTLIPEGNEAAGKFIELLLFRKEGYLREAFLKDGKFQGLTVRGLLRSDWERGF